MPCEAASASGVEVGVIVWMRLAACWAGAADTVSTRTAACSLGTGSTRARKGERLPGARTPTVEYAVAVATCCPAVPSTARSTRTLSTVCDPASTSPTTFRLLLPT